MEEAKDIKSCSTCATAGASSSTAKLNFNTGSATPIPASTNDTGAASVGADLCPPQEEVGGVLEEGEAVQVTEQFLLNPEVTELILGVLDLGRLKACRLVCKSWSFEISRMLKARARVDLMSLKDSREFMATCESGAKLNLPLPFKGIRLVCMKVNVLPAVVKDLQRYPFSISEIITTGGVLSETTIEKSVLRYLFTRRNWRRAVRAQRALLFALQKCGQSLELLGLSASLNSVGAQSFCFPNLKELSLLETLESDTIPQHGDNLRSIFNSAPNLRHLQAAGQTLPKRIVESWKGLEKLQRFWLRYDGPPEDILIPMSGFHEGWALQSFHLCALEAPSTLTDTAISELLFQFLVKVSSSIDSLACFLRLKLVGAFPSCPLLTRLYLSPQTDLLDLLSFANLKALKALTQLPDALAEKDEQVPIIGSIQDYTQLQGLYSLDLLNKYANNYVAWRWLKSYSLAFPMVTVWTLSPEYLRELSTLAFYNEIRVRSLTVRYKGCDLIQVYLGYIKMIPGLQVLQLCNRTEKMIQDLHLNSIDLNKLRSLKILNFYYSTYEDVMSALEELKRLESISIFGIFRTNRDRRFDDILLKLPQAIGSASRMLDRIRW